MQGTILNVMERAELLPSFGLDEHMNEMHKITLDKNDKELYYQTLDGRTVRVTEENDIRNIYRKKYKFY